MKSLFGDNRQADILSLMRGGTSLSIDLLAQKLSVSDRTIRNDIKTINETLGDSGIIETDQGICSLRIFDVDSFQTAYSHIIATDDLMNSPSRRMDYIFGKLMFSFSPVLTDDLAYEMNVGRTTLIKDLKKLRKTIEPYNLSIIGKTSQGLILQGSEINIRRYVIENCYDALFNDYPIDLEILDTIQSNFTRHPFSDRVQQQFKKYFILMMDRFLKGHFIGHLPTYYYALAARDGFGFVNTVVDQVGHLLQVDFPIEEKIYMLMPIIGMRTPTNAEELYNIKLDDKITPLTEEITKAINDQLDIQIDTYEFTEEFMYHLMFMINRLRYGIKVENPLIEEIQKKYPIAFEMATIAANVVSKKFDVKIPQSEIGFLATYFGVFIEVNNLHHRNEHMALVCGSGIVTSRLIMVQLQHVVDSDTRVDTFTPNEITPDKLNAYDVVLSTVPIDFDLNRPVIYIREIFDEDELRSRLKKAEYWQPSNTSMDDNWYVLANLLKEENFFDLSDYDTYTSACDFMMDCLIDEGSVDAGFKERMHDREKKGTMIFGHLLALPHTIQTISNELVIAFGIFSHPVDDVQIIILLGLPKNVEENDKLLIRIYDEIMTIVKDDDLIKKITQCKTQPELLRVLYKRI
ncbi:transcription antiterminator [Absicoccus porci]|jgi:lichenan operon transcriptional antiterminator|uniref:BglG family transcription antiterminator n=1 Tax=Absicoccus porci TaxID=2486576 RepID=UPI002409012F|nr:PRD domain-containing protein [Absicoccus porci]MDD6459160.1 PRD domain-containing protein [Absicoccus porci]